MSVSFIANVAAVVLALPLLLVLSFAAARTSMSLLPLGIVLLLGILPNPALAGLQSSARLLVRDGDTPFRAFTAGMKRYWWPAAILWACSLPVTAILLLNIAFYGGLFTHDVPGGSFAGPIEAVWLAAFCFWVALHLYAFPLLLAQDRLGPMAVYRNAAVIVLRRPFYSFGVEVIWVAVLLFLSTTGLAAVFGLMLAALIQQVAFLHVLPGLQGGE
jgi:hypothetical protein